MTTIFGAFKMNRLQKCKNLAVTFQDAVTSTNSCLRHFYDWEPINTSLPLPTSDTSINETYHWSWNVLCYAIMVATFFALKLWFRKYKFRYLLRINLFIFAFFVISKCVFYDTNEKRGTYYYIPYIHESYPASISLSTLFLLIYIRYHWSLPFNIKQSVQDVNAKHLKRSSRVKYKTTEQLTDEKFQYFPNEMPPVFPNGWIPILESEKLSEGCSKTVEAVGKKFCVFRGYESIAYVLDAYCPHLGAELAAGGKVRNECIECPFHEWLFDGKSGKCLHIPYAEGVPSKVKINTWHSCEKNGFIFVWHHAEGDDPYWDMPSLEHVQSGRWKFRGKTDHEVHCHIQEIPENGADIAHLSVVHSKSVFSGQFRLMSIADAIFDCIEHEWQPCGWTKDEERPYIGKIKLCQRMRIFGISLPYFRLDMNIEQIGPATVHLEMETSFGKAVLLQHIIPEKPLCHRIVHMLYTEPQFKQLPADLFMLSEAIMLERDIVIWNNKRYLKRPVLVREDRLIKSFRKWYSQFYSPNSLTLRDIRTRTLDW